MTLLAIGANILHSLSRVDASVGERPSVDSSSRVSSGTDTDTLAFPTIRPPSGVIRGASQRLSTSSVATTSWDSTKKCRRSASATDAMATGAPFRAASLRCSASASSSATVACGIDGAAMTRIT